MDAEEQTSWFLDQRFTWRAVILSRCALRQVSELIPLVAEADRTVFRSTILLQCFRGHAALSAFALSRDVKAGELTVAAADLGRDLRDLSSALSGHPTRIFTSLHAVYEDDREAVRSLLTPSRLGNEFFDALNEDIEFLNQTRSVARLSAKSAWNRDRSSIGKRVIDESKRLYSTFESSNTAWRVWQEWLNGKIEGYYPFGLKRPSSNQLDEEIARIPSDTWRLGPQRVASAVTAIVERLRQTPPPISRQELSDFILHFLAESSGAHSTSEVEAAAREAGLRIGGTVVRSALNRLVASEQVVRLQRDAYSVPVEDASTSARALAELGRLGESEPQRTVAIQFARDELGRISVDQFGGSHELATDAEAVDRHGETVRAASSLLGMFDPAAPGANSAVELIAEVQSYVDALGASIATMRAALVVIRGDGLRALLAAQTDGADVSDLAPLSPKYLLRLKTLVAAHNLMVGLDPSLARRDQAILGPDVDLPLIAPSEGIRVVKIAVEGNFATKEVELVLLEEARQAPVVPSEKVRASRRFSEGIRNFGRAAISIVRGASRLLWKHKGKVAAAVVGLPPATIAMAKWIVTNEAWFTTLFAGNSTMASIVHSLLTFLKSLPLL